MPGLTNEKGEVASGYNEKTNELQNVLSLSITVLNMHHQMLG